VKLFTAIFNFDPSLVPESVLRATCEEPASNVLIHALVVPRQIPSICGGMNGRVGVVIVFAVSRLLELALLQTFSRREQLVRGRKGGSILPSETSPRSVRHLLLD